MGRYTIKELEQLSGIKAHTIRIWEKRHQLIVPQRTSTNIRYYSDDDLKKIINVSVLNNNGLKISKIAELTPSEMSQRVVELTQSTTETDVYIDQLIVAMVDLEEEQFDRVLSHLQLKFGFTEALFNVVYPFLEKIGILWQTGNITPAQEHFISNLIRQKLMVAIDSLPLAPKSSKRVVLFLPENELHELGLLAYNYLARQLGFRTYYLGQHVPYTDLKQVCESHHPHFIITALTNSQHADQSINYVKNLVREFPGVRVLASGHILDGVDLSQFPNYVHFSKSLEIKQLLF